MTMQSRVIILTVYSNTEDFLLMFFANVVYMCLCLCVHVCVCVLACVSVGVGICVHVFCIRA